MMRNQRQQVSEVNLTAPDQINNVRALEDNREYFDKIPIDLVVKIFSKMSSTKSMAKCRCVSKLWSSIIRSPYYKVLFPTKPPDPPRLLFILVDQGKLFFYTSPQPKNLNPDEGSSSLVATLHHRMPIKDRMKLCGPVNGLFCQQHVGDDSIVLVVSNPITGESVILPKLTTKKVDEAKIYLGYDPIEKQFKVLSITWVCGEKDPQHQVLTLENGGRDLLWRNIECCINGQTEVGS